MIGALLDVLIPNLVLILFIKLIKSSDRMSFFYIYKKKSNAIIFKGKNGFELVKGFKIVYSKLAKGLKIVYCKSSHPFVILISALRKRTIQHRGNIYIYVFTHTHTSGKRKCKLRTFGL